MRTQLAALRRCNQTLYEQPRLLARLPPEEILTYFGLCWRGTWRDHVTNILPYVCVRSWLAAGFAPHQFMLVRQTKLRTARAKPLLAALANFTGLHYNRAVLHDKEEELNVHCEAPASVSNSDSPSSGVAGSARRRAHAHEAARPMVNSHSTYTGHDAVRRTKLSPSLQADLARLAEAHSSMLDELQLQELA